VAHLYCASSPLVRESWQTADKITQGLPTRQRTAACPVERPLVRSTGIASEAGASWEGFALEEVLRVTGDRDAYFWHTQGGAALDLLVFLNGERFGFEFKYADVPTVTRSLQWRGTT